MSALFCTRALIIHSPLTDYHCHRPASARLDNRVLDFPRKQVSEMGFPFYGVLMIAHTKSKTEDLKLWIAKRSEDKVLYVHRPCIYDVLSIERLTCGMRS